MTREEAKRLLHPDTTKEALFGTSREEGIALVEEACLVACGDMDRLSIFENWLDAFLKSDAQIYTKSEILNALQEVMSFPQPEKEECDKEVSL